MNNFIVSLLCIAGITGSSARQIQGDAPPRISLESIKTTEVESDYATALAAIDWDAVKADIRHLLTDSQDFWPADYGNYGPLFVRQAWHCSGSYRTSDGRGGCAGGRQRFEPERSWPDNTNLDKPKVLLAPIKEKYGLGLSWGDLMILAGNTAIEAMGGPVLGFCAGREDADDGAESIQLGPSAVQEQDYPCPVNGECKVPLGSTTVGLIYLNPEGPLGVPDPRGSARDVRDSFGRMAMNDSETVALIGGGHAFGKTHGACPAGPGPAPKDAPNNPWPGACGSGKGADSYTAGFEGPWTSDPTHWDNEYFRTLDTFRLEKYMGPGAKWQWAVGGNHSTAGPTAPPVAKGAKAQRIMMLTSDVSLTVDSSYKQLVHEYAISQDQFDSAFAHAWYKLTTRDMGPITRCLQSPMLPPPQPFQYPLPPPPTHLPDFAAVAKAIEARVFSLPEPLVRQQTFALLVNLAYQCASTFRRTDFQGGCNGARIRFSPEADWGVNAGLEDALALLRPVQAQFEGLSWADLVVFSGTLALQHAPAAPGAEIGPLPFCPGRTDAADGVGSQYLRPWLTGNFSDSVDHLAAAMQRSGLTAREAVVLMGRLRSALLQRRKGFAGSWTAAAAPAVSNAYFQALVQEQWQEFADPATGVKQYKAAGKDLYMEKTDILLLHRPEWKRLAADYAAYNDLFLTDFAAAWTKLMNIDRFDGPTGNVCDKVEQYQTRATTLVATS